MSQCEQQYGSGVFLYGNLTSCLTLNCAVCTELGAGDPCAPHGPACNTGLTCSGLWCTRACGGSSDCAGLGPGGGNALGPANACIRSAAGGTCAPGCATDADCVAFPGTYCFATIASDGLSVQVCVSSP